MLHFCYSTPLLEIDLWGQKFVLTCSKKERNKTYLVADEGGLRTRLQMYYIIILLTSNDVHSVVKIFADLLGFDRMSNAST